MKIRHLLLAALGASLLGGAATMACTSPDRAYGPETSATSSGAGGSGTGGSGSGSSSSGDLMSTGTGTTSQLPCATKLECPGKDTDCEARTCDLGVCGLSFGEAGKDVTSQFAGDCQKIVCDGQGGLTLQVDLTDVPEDSNPCTLDVCNAGEPDHKPAPFGTMCGSGGAALTCDNQGHCTGCMGPGECPGLDTDCQQRSCASTVCGFIYQPVSTPVSTQTPNDCQQKVCNGSGVETVTFDNADVMDDGNPCTQDACSSGSPTHTNTAAGASCGLGNSSSVCNGSGACVECATAASCKGQGDECSVRTCVAGACGFAFEPMGKPVAFQVAGDCKKGVCDGNGGVTQIPDDADVQSDSNVCTGDTCSMGTIGHPNVAAGTACGGVKTCDGAGKCTGCTVSSDCGGIANECQTPTCVGGTCGFSFAPYGQALAGQTPGDCKKSVCDGSGNVVVAIDDSDVGLDTDECTSDICSGGTPMHPIAAPGTPCTKGGVFCNYFGMCNECNPGASDSFGCVCDSGIECCGGLPAAVPIVSDANKATSDLGDDPGSTPDQPPCCCPTFRTCSQDGTWGDCGIF